MPSTASATIDIPPVRAADEAFQRFINLSMRNAIYTFGKKYTRWRAFFPGSFVPVLMIEGKFLRFRAKPAHLVGHLPDGGQREQGAQNHVRMRFLGLFY